MAVTNQELKLASLYTKLGITDGPNAIAYEAAFHKYWDSLAIRAAGSFNERMLLWINAALVASYTNLQSAQQAYAVAKGKYNWDSLGDLGLP